jgi:hypothetical protein
LPDNAIAGLVDKSANNPLVATVLNALVSAFNAIALVVVVA